jgi:hypothetical protein
MSANIALVEGAKAHVREITEALNECGIEPRFDVEFEGFGTGCTAGVSAEGALRYLDDLIGTHDPHTRYHTPLKNVTVSARLRPKVFAA